MSDQLPNIELQPRRPVAVLAIAVTGVVASTSVTTITYAVNAWICPLYFNELFPGFDPDDIFRASVERGYFYGLLGGICLSFMYAMAIITGLRRTYLFAARNVLGIVSGTILCWVLGGLFGMLHGYIDHDLLHDSIPAQPINGMEVRMEIELPISITWVSGSIWGLYIGGFVSMAVGLFVFQARWFQALLRSDLH